MTENNDKKMIITGQDRYEHEREDKKKPTTPIALVRVRFHFPLSACYCQYLYDSRGVGSFAIQVLDPLRA